MRHSCPLGSPCCGNTLARDQRKQEHVPKISQLGNEILGEKDVLALDVAMDDGLGFHAMQVHKRRALATPVSILRTVPADGGCFFAFAIKLSRVPPTTNSMTRSKHGSRADPKNRTTFVWLTLLSLITSHLKFVKPSESTSPLRIRLIPTKMSSRYNRSV